MTRSRPGKHGGPAVACARCHEIVQLADRRIRGLQDLLTYYRVGRRPTESVLQALDDSTAAWEQLPERERTK